MDPITPLERARTEATRLVSLLPPALQPACTPPTTNALWNLLQEPDFRLDKWIAGMARIAPSCQTEAEWRTLGQIQAWRHGLAWIREGALERWSTLSPPLQSISLGIEGPIPADFLLDPWLRPNQKVTHWKLFTRTFGGFRGFGKQFLQPPRVVAHQGRLFAIDQDRWWAIHTDVFGGTLRRIEAPQSAPDRWEATEWKLLIPERRVVFRDLTAPLSFPPTHIAATPHTLAITFSNSHRIHIFGRTPA